MLVRHGYGQYDLNLYELATGRDLSHIEHGSKLRFSVWA